MGRMQAWVVILQAEYSASPPLNHWGASMAPSLTTNWLGGLCIMQPCPLPLIGGEGWGHMAGMRGNKSAWEARMAVILLAPLPPPFSPPQQAAAALGNFFLLKISQILLILQTLLGFWRICKIANSIGPYQSPLMPTHSNQSPTGSSCLGQTAPLCLWSWGPLFLASQQFT